MGGQILPIGSFLPLADVYKAVMKWAVFAPALLHPLLYFAFSPEARHGAYIMFTRCCSCCCPKANAEYDVKMRNNSKMMERTFHYNRIKKTKCESQVGKLTSMIIFKMPANINIATFPQTRALPNKASKCSPIKDCVHVKSLKVKNTSLAITPAPVSRC